MILIHIMNALQLNQLNQLNQSCRCHVHPQDEEHAPQKDLLISGCTTETTLAHALCHRSQSSSPSPEIVQLDQPIQN